jgi:hypothetical protein
MNETREQWLAALIEEMRGIFAVHGHPLPEKIRPTCGFPSSKARSKHKHIGEHWSPAASDDDTHEVSVSPVVSDPYEVAGILTHELCHAACDGDGHRGRFPDLARKLWLEGIPSEAKAGDAFKLNFKDIIESLGEYPHAALNVGRVLTPQTTRMLKACCTSIILPNGKQCGYTVRLTKKWADIGLPTCPLHSHKTMTLS